MTNTLHAKHGPSSLKNKELCSHWVNRPGSSAAAEEGTKMHEAAETGRLDGLNPEQIVQVRECLVRSDFRHCRCGADRHQYRNRHRLQNGACPRR